MKKSLFLVLFTIILTATTAFAGEYKVLVLSDNITAKPCLDAVVYEESAEFFANQVINRLNTSGSVEAPTISVVREELKKNPRLAITTRETMLRFKKEYNINYVVIQKLATMFNVDKVLLITTSADAQNYFMRRTFWDFLNVPGATVIDPAIKLSTYAVLIDTNRMVNLWEDTFYKTISSCENRMVPNSLGPQTVQLEKIRDYSQMLGPQIASNVQTAIVPKSRINYKNEITYGPKDFDNVLTKKYRWYKKGAVTVVKDAGNQYNNHQTTQRENGVEPLTDKIKRKYAEYKMNREFQKQEKQRIKEQNARIKQIKQEMMQQEKTEQQNIQKVNNKTPDIEVTDIAPVPPIPTEKKTKTKSKPVQQEPKIINISKEEQIIEEKPVEPIKYQYYKPTKHVPIIKNSTINDI